MYSRQHPPRPVPMVYVSRRNRKYCIRHVFSIQGVFFIVFVSFVCLGYWIGQTGYLEENPWLVKSQTVAPPLPVKPDLEPDEFKPINGLAVNDVIDPTIIQSLNSSRSAFYVLCNHQSTIEYVQYLSLASVTRFYHPSHLFFLYETEVPVLLPGKWTTLTRLDDLLRMCNLRFMTIRMRNASHVCGDSIKMEEFIMKLLFQFGGLYVGRRTFMTEMVTFMRPNIIEEHILSHLSDDLEGFVYIKAAITTTELPSNHSGPPLHPKGHDPRPSQDPPFQIKYITSRQLHCHESVTMMKDGLHTNAGGVRHACLIIRDQVKVDPWAVVRMRSDFGTFTRKAIFNIYNEQETQFYLRVTNTSATPPLCSID